MATEWQKEQARKQARAEGKVPAGDKKARKRTVLTSAQLEQKDIDAYKAGAKKLKKDTRTLKSLTHYGKGDSTATSGGSKAVRKIDPKFKGKTTAVRSKDDSKAVNELRRKPLKYIE